MSGGHKCLFVPAAAMSAMDSVSEVDRLAGTLLGVAVGDALGLPAEGLSARAIERRFGRLDRFRLFGRTGFVSDDTEQAALVAQSLVRSPRDLDGCVRAFRRALLAWFCRLPCCVGRATVRSCGRIALGISPSGVRSAGNGSAMRAAIVGTFFHDDQDARRAFGRALAEVTHRDDRAIEGALYVAELAAALVAEPGVALTEAVKFARSVVGQPQLGENLDRAIALAARGAETREAAIVCGTSGYVVHTVAFATFCFLRFGDDPRIALMEAVSAGGDTDSVGAVLGGWLGARHRQDGLPGELIARIHDGPFGPTHLRALADCLAAVRRGERVSAPSYSPAAALARNLALYPVIVGHVVRRLLPF